MTARNQHTSFTLYPPRSRYQRIEFDDPKDQIDYTSFWRGLAIGLALVAPVWLAVFALAWVRWFS